MDEHTCKQGVAWVVILLATGLAQMGQAAAHVEGMTYTQAKARIPDRSLPGFWVGDVQGLAARFEHLKRGKLALLGVTPGGRPIQLVTFGDKETVAHRANFNSAIGGQEQETDKKRCQDDSC